MKIDKAKEILDLNIREAGTKMPPDVKTAVQIGSEAINYIIRLRACSIKHRQAILPSELISTTFKPPEH